jgi:hypothetical protein
MLPVDIVAAEWGRLLAPVEAAGTAIGGRGQGNVKFTIVITDDVEQMGSLGLWLENHDCGLRRPERGIGVQLRVRFAPSGPQA